MLIWHLTADAPRVPRRVSPGERVEIRAGSWPVEPGQSLEARYVVTHPGGEQTEGRVQLGWQYNAGSNSYWRAEIGPFRSGDRVRYALSGASLAGPQPGPQDEIRVGPKLCLALLWHQHQPLYKNTASSRAAGSYSEPWVRLHAIRDYYSMAARVAEHPGVHLTINLTPCLLWQLEDYVRSGATDRALELSLRPVERLESGERTELVRGFFEAERHGQIAPHPRYEELFLRRVDGREFSDGELRDLQAWFNLAWFGKEFRDADVRLVTGEVVSVRRFVERGRDFSHDDVEAIVAEQIKILRAVVPLHRALQERGQIEVSTTPFYHPILPLLIDTDRATIDLPGATFPRRFAHPEDADQQVARAVDYYRRAFGCAPRGMWPAEGAVAQSVIPLFARHGVRWIATDRDVLARSGRFGYRAEDPDVLCRPYRAENGEDKLSVFFRDTRLSDAIGFHYQHYEDPAQAASDFTREVKERFAWRVTGEEPRVLSVVLDGENAWGSYRDDGRPFLHALYGALENDPEIAPMSFSEFLDGAPAHGVAASPLDEQARVYDLFTASWIDERNSAPGVDLGTWIGEDEENQGWNLLGNLRDTLDRAGVTPGDAPAAFEALYAAEGSDWFWWFGADQNSGHDEVFDELFRMHVANAYRAAGLEPSPEVRRRIVPKAVLWTLSERPERVQSGDVVVVRTNCPGVLTWQIDGRVPESRELAPAGGAMGGGVRHYQLALDPLPPGAEMLRVHFRCTRADCKRDNAACGGDEQVISVTRA
jgi:alpha-amylase/alpha-mannosidase (GH57 family)